MTTNCIFKNRQLPIHNIVNKGFCDMRRFVACPLHFSCNRIDNRPQSLTVHIVNRYRKFKKIKQ